LVLAGPAFALGRPARLEAGSALDNRGEVLVERLEDFLGERLGDFLVVRPDDFLGERLADFLSERSDSFLAGLAPDFCSAFPDPLALGVGEEDFWGEGSGRPGFPGGGLEEGLGLTAFSPPWLLLTKRSGFPHFEQKALVSKLLKSQLGHLMVRTSPK